MRAKLLISSAALSAMCVGLWSSGCARNTRQDERASPIVILIDGGQRLFDRRGEDPENLQQAITFWQEGLATFPRSVNLLEVLTKAWTEKALYDSIQPVDADHPHELEPRALIVAREYGTRCILRNPNVQNLVNTFGRLDNRAINESPNVTCLVWTSLAWSRWLQYHGVAGAAIDLKGVQQMARHAMRLQPDYDRGRAHHAFGLSLSLPPEPMEPDLEKAERELKLAMEAAPNRWLVKYDLATQVYGRQPDRSTEFNTLLTEIINDEVEPSSEDALMNQVAQTLAAEALREGPRPQWAPKP